MALRVENERVDASVSKCDKQQAKKYRPITSLVTVNTTAVWSWGNGLARGK